MELQSNLLDSNLVPNVNLSKGLRNGDQNWGLGLRETGVVGVLQTMYPGVIQGLGSLLPSLIKSPPKRSTCKITQQNLARACIAAVTHVWLHLLCNCCMSSAWREIVLTGRSLSREEKKTGLESRMLSAGETSKGG